MEAKSWLQSAFDKRWSEKRTAAALAPVQAPPDVAAGPVRTARSCPYDPGAHAGSACAGKGGTERGAPVRRTPAHLHWALIMVVCCYYDGHMGGVGRLGWRRWGEKAGSGRPDQKSCEILKRPRLGGPLGTASRSSLDHSEGPGLSARACGLQRHAWALGVAHFHASNVSCALPALVFCINMLV